MTIRSLLGLLAVGLCLPTPATADEGSALKPTASFFTRSELRDNFEGIGKTDSDFIRYRARFGLNLLNKDLGNGTKVNLSFVPQSAGFWSVGGSSLADADLNMHEAKLQIFKGVNRIDIGRFEMAYGEHLVLGTVGWHHSGRSFDAVRFHHEASPGVWVDAFVSSLAEGSLSGATNPIGAGDHYLVGLYSGLGGLVSKGFNLDAYLLAQLWPDRFRADPADMATPNTKAAREVTLGTRVKNKAGALDYRLEAGLQLGTRPGAEPVDVFAYQADVEVGLSPAKGLRVALEGFAASGDDGTTTDKNEAWNHLYPTAHKWMGFSDIIGPRSNIQGGVLHTSYKSGALRYSLDAHGFMRAQDVGDKKAGFAASELDLGVKYAIAKGLGLRGGYALFMPTDDWYGTTDMVHFGELELSYKLK